MDYVRLVKVKMVESRFSFNGSKRNSFVDSSVKEKRTSMNAFARRRSIIVISSSEKHDKPSVSSISQPRDAIMTTIAERINHGRLVLVRWEELLDIISQGGKKHATVDGVSLNVANVVAVARYGATPTIGENVFDGMDESSEFMRVCLANGQTIYGVNTGFGGSANTHTDKVEKLQSNLISFLNCGVIASVHEHVKNKDSQLIEPSIFTNALPNEDLLASTVMPESWVRATLIIRSNTLAGGFSGCRPALVSNLARLLRDNITPVIPLRGSISASGDLIPLSYVAATLQGKSCVEVWVNDLTHTSRGRKRVTAEMALSNSLLQPLALGPKEGLAIVNGTAVSAGVASLALHDAHLLVVLSQILTAMGVEALRGSDESFDPFFSKVRPHPGQAEVAGNIRGFLKGSSLVCDKERDYEECGSLRQDRYSIRTTPQWLGPLLEDMMLADQQISVEVNSTTDNPLIDAPNEKILHGGNFQAMSVTSAMEKTRSAIQAVGRMLFSQCTELINPVYNNGLPPNLTADEPSQTYPLKGVDISLAALQAELGLLTSPVGPNVQNAEMGNQSLNSLALISARYTHTAVSILSQMSAAYLFSLCQALDLRALHTRFLNNVETEFRQSTFKIFGPLMANSENLHEKLWLEFKKCMATSTGSDSSVRFTKITQGLQSIILLHAATHCKNDSGLIKALRTWADRSATLCLQTYQSTRASYASNPDPTEFLGMASKKMYRFVRSELEIPFQITNPDPATNNAPALFGERTMAVGAFVSKIHVAIQNGSLYVPAMECLREVITEQE